MKIRIIIFILSSFIIGGSKYFNTSLALNGLGYKEYILSKDGREGELTSGMFCMFFWCVIFLYDVLSHTVSIIDSNIFTLLLGCMEGISINSVYTLKFMPKGIYEKGILTETKAVLYENIKRYEVMNLKKRSYKCYCFTFKSSSKKTLNLFVNNRDCSKVNLLLKSHKI